MPVPESLHHEPPSRFVLHWIITVRPTPHQRVGNDLWEVAAWLFVIVHYLITVHICTAYCRSGPLPPSPMHQIGWQPRYEWKLPAIRTPATSPAAEAGRTSKQARYSRTADASDFCSGRHLRRDVEKSERRNVVDAWVTVQFLARAFADKLQNMRAWSHLNTTIDGEWQVQGKHYEDGAPSTRYVLTIRSY